MLTVAWNPVTSPASSLAALLPSASLARKAPWVEAEAAGEKASLLFKSRVPDR